MTYRDPDKLPADHDDPRSHRAESEAAELEELLDAALDQTFPASDPVALTPSPRVQRHPEPVSVNTGAIDVKSNTHGAV